MRLRMTLNLWFRDIGKYERGSEVAGTTSDTRVMRKSVNILHRHESGKIPLMRCPGVDIPSCQMRSLRPLP